MIIRCRKRTRLGCGRRLRRPRNGSSRIVEHELIIAVARTSTGRRDGVIWHSLSGCSPSRLPHCHAPGQISHGLFRCSAGGCFRTRCPLRADAQALICSSIPRSNGLSSRFIAQERVYGTGAAHLGGGETASLKLKKPGGGILWGIGPRNSRNSHLAVEGEYRASGHADEAKEKVD